MHITRAVDGAGTRSDWRLAILKATMQPPKDGTTHWSARRLAAKLGVNHMMVARAWERAGLQPHRVESYVASNDPDFEAKALDVIALVAEQPADRQVHIILDNLSAHKTKLVNEFVGRHPNVRLHFTPTYSSWLNQVELWLNKLERQVIARGIFRSTTDLAKKLMLYVREHNKTAKPIKWKYTDPSRRMRNPLSSVTAH